MARKTQMVRMHREPKFAVRRVRRCQRCGRSKSVLRAFNLCRICLRTLALEGKIPGVVKASW